MTLLLSQSEDIVCCELGKYDCASSKAFDLYAQSSSFGFKIQRSLSNDLNPK
jgi:hypothetical protein